MDLKTRNNKKSYTLPDMYRSYRIENEAPEVPYLRFKRILDKFNEVVRDSILERSEGFKTRLCLYR